MALTVVIDCLDPDALVEFCAAALGYRPIEVPGLDQYPGPRPNCHRA